MNEAKAPNDRGEVTVLARLPNGTGPRPRQLRMTVGPDIWQRLVRWDPDDQQHSRLRTSQWKREQELIHAVRTAATHHKPQRGLASCKTLWHNAIDRLDNHRASLHKLILTTTLTESDAVEATVDTEPGG